VAAELRWRSRGAAAATPLLLWATGCVVARSMGLAPEPPPVDERLVLEGNERIGDAALRRAVREDLERLVERGHRKSDVDDVAFEIERHYRNEGYHFARADYDYSPSRSVIRIQEGPRVLLQEVSLFGNLKFPSRELIPMLPERRAGFLGLGGRLFVESDVERFAGAIEDAYYERGFLDIRVGEPEVTFSSDRTRARVAIVLSEGPQYVLRGIEAVELPIVSERSLRKATEHLVGSAYVPRLRLAVTSAVEGLYGDEGYPDARATVEEVIGPLEREKKLVGVTLRIHADPGSKVSIREILVRGNLETSTDFIRSRILLRPGDVFDASKLRQSFRRLFGTGAFRTADLRLVDGKGETERDLLVQVQEAPSLEYYAEVGFGSFDLLRGRLGMRERNLFGQGIIGRTELTGSARGAELTFALRDPWFLRSEWTADLPLSFLQRAEPSFSIREARLTPRLSRPFGRHESGGLQYRFRLSRLEDLDVETEPRFASLEDRNLLVGALGPFFDLDSRDDFFIPTRGTRSRLFAEIGSRALGGDISFLHGGASIVRFWRLLEGTVLAATAQTEWIVPVFGTDVIPIQERLFLGGENTVRSFRESELGPKDRDGDALGGEVRNFASIELRQHLIERLDGALFVDAGDVGFTASDALDDIRWAIGFGLRYGLPIGPLRLDVGFNPDRRADEDRFVIQVAVGMPY
jgi:outer membrane protein insertion porin family